jgi:serine/threonine protein kinase
METLVGLVVHFCFQGLKYLHDNFIGCHGNLKTSNCVIDSRWVLKLTHFGLTDFREGEKKDMTAHSTFQGTGRGRHCPQPMRSAYNQWEARNGHAPRHRGVGSHSVVLRQFQHESLTTVGSKSNIPCYAGTPRAAVARNICMIAYTYTNLRDIMRQIHAGCASHPRIQRKCRVHLARARRDVTFGPLCMVTCSNHNPPI